MVLSLGVAAAAAEPPAPATAPARGVAVGIVLDTSGSMRDAVPDASGRPAPKHAIANRALQAVIKRLAAARQPEGPAPRPVAAGLVVFRQGRAATAVPFGPFDETKFRAWLKDFRGPDGATPLGNAIDLAGKAVLKSRLPHKHILVITDGLNTSGPKPEGIIPRLQKAARQAETTLAFHFVAFDVDAKAFRPVKELGATLVAAANEAELNARLGYIIEQKILLEDEE